MFVTNLHNEGALEDALEEVLINELDDDLQVLGKVRKVASSEPVVRS